jgi:serine/threonine protein kinase
VISKLGQGGFANVLLVKDGNQQAALKVLRTSTGATITSALCKFSNAPAQAPEVALFREARALKHARHP